MTAHSPPRVADVPCIADQAHDIQAILGSGFASLRHCSYWLLQVTDAELACAWIKRLREAGWVKSVADLGQVDAPGGARQAQPEVAMLAFSHDGLLALGLEPSDDMPFPTPFAMGMADPRRRELLGEPDLATPWQWGDAGGAHLLLAHYRRAKAVAEDSLCHRRQLARCGLEIVRVIDTCPSYIQAQNMAAPGEWAIQEPFGFADGISQPIIDGLRSTRAERAARRLVGPMFEDRVVAPGEFVLGYRTQYGELAYCPDVKSWPREAAGGRAFGFNGSYLAVRQIRQFVQDLRDFEAQHAVPGETVSLAEKMMGRRKSGQPLVDCPFAAADRDAFRYRVADADGLQCPRGAHVRRANPRDTLGWDVESGIEIAKLHRILRRGRAYANPGARACQQDGAACGDPSHRDHPCGQGLFFMALNANLERQFELVQQRWVSSRTFDGLSNETDPVAGAAPPRAFTVQGLPTGRRIDQGIPAFTEVLGGGYFFVPSLAALDHIASGCR